MTYLTISDLVDCGDIPASTWRRWASTNVVRAVRIKRVWWINTDDAMKAATLRGHHRRLPSLTR